MRIVDSHRSLESNDENFGVSYNQRNGYQFYLTDGELPGCVFRSIPVHQFR